MRKASLVLLATGIATFVTLVLTEDASAIPAFARKYRTSCLTCHTMMPKLNAFGEAFRLNGYQIPDGDEPHIKDEPLVTAAPAWKEAWPQANWPGWIPGSPPIAIRLQVDTESTKDETKKYSTNFEFPHEVELLWGGTFGEDLGFFGEVEWKQRGGVSSNDGKIETKQAFLKFQNPLEWAGVPRRWLNLWIGQMDQVWLTSYRNLDRVGINHPLWGNKKPDDFTVRNLTTGVTRRSGNSFRLQDMVPGIELNGILGSRLFWAGGVTTGAGESRFDIDNHKDAYYKLRYKIGGRAYDGSLPGEKGVSLAAPARGAWVDNALQIEHFGYFGRQRITTTPASASRSTDSFNRFGIALRWTWQDLDLAGGLVWGRHQDPWGNLSTSKLDYSAPFARLDYMIFPWWMAQLRFEDLHMSSPKDLRAAGFTAGSLDQTRFIPALVFLIRANLRFVMEGELYTRHKDFESRKLSIPHAFWTRFDFAM